MTAMEVQIKSEIAAMVGLSGYTVEAGRITASMGDGFMYVAIATTGDDCVSEYLPVDMLLSANAEASTNLRSLLMKALVFDLMAFWEQQAVESVTDDRHNVGCIYRYGAVANGPTSCDCDLGDDDSTAEGR